MTMKKKTTKKMTKELRAEIDAKQERNLIALFTNRIEKAIKNGEKMTWQSFLSHIDAFFNPSTKKTYKGFFNGIIMSVVSMSYGGEMRFVGGGQCKNMGGRIKDGEWGKTTPIYCPVIVMKETENGEKVSKRIGFRQVFVYNIRQTDLIERGLIPEKVADCNKDTEPIESVQEFVKFIDFDQVVSTGCPYYSPLADNIGMPDFKQFHNKEMHSESLLHELVHWTGHETRLKRLIPGWRNEKSYSREELVAELGAALLMNHLGCEVSEEHLANQTAYLKNWLGHLKDDITILADAARDSSYAVRHLIKLSKEGKEKTK